MLDLKQLTDRVKEHGQFTPDFQQYLRSVQSTPTLSDEDVIELVVQIGIGGSALEQLKAKEYDSEMERLSLDALNKAGADALKRLLPNTWHWVAEVALCFIGPGTHFTQLIQAGQEGMSRAATTYWLICGCSFKDYAHVWIEHSIMQSIHDNSVVTPSLRQLAKSQAIRRRVLEEKLGRQVNLEELAIAMRYLTVEQTRQISEHTHRIRHLPDTLRDALRVAKTKALLVQNYLEIARHFTMQLVVTVEGEKLCYDNIIGFEQQWSENVDEFYRCGRSRSVTPRKASDVSSDVNSDLNQVGRIPNSTLASANLVAQPSAWRCPECERSGKEKGCGKWQKASLVRAHPLPVMIVLDDGSRIQTDDDFTVLVRQLGVEIDL